MARLKDMIERLQELQQTCGDDTPVQVEVKVGERVLKLEVWGMEKRTPAGEHTQIILNTR